MQKQQILSISSMSPPDSKLMALGDNLSIHPDVLVGQGLFCSGVPGTGKSSILARILEQISQFHIPSVTFDLEGDLLSTVEYMPRGVICTAQNCASARDVLGQGLQVVYDLSTWPTLEDKGSFVARMATSLFQASEALPPAQRVPCLIAMDEASLFLPQRRGLSFSPDVYRELFESFHRIATMGRKRGLTPLLFTQKVGEVAKAVLAPGNFFTLKQTVHSDLKRCLDYVEKSGVFGYMTEKQIMSYIASLTPGQAIVRLSTGEQKIVQFYERESIHVSHTPTTQAALNRYSSLSFNPDMCFGADVEEDEPVATKYPDIVKQSETVTQAFTGPECSRRACHEKATHVYTYHTLRVSASGKLSEEKYQYFCTKHSNKKMRPL